VAISGGWKDSRSVQAGARKWGTGINPIHAERTADGRHVAPEGYDGVDEYLTTVWQDDGYSNDPFQGENHEHAHDIGLYDRPNYGDNPQHERSGAREFPQWGRYQSGVPGGTEIRGRKHGADDTQTPNQIPTETVSEGWLNKPHGEVEDAVTSDLSQVLMNTSMTQRDKVREGSQRGDGSQDDPRAPIASRMTGQKVKVYSGGERHEDMRPKTQTQRIRGWWNRTAGTASPRMMEVNAQQVRRPLQREVPADPYVQPPAVVDAPNYGYQDEDMIPYA
jgi:hypothetical protein